MLELVLYFVSKVGFYVYRGQLGKVQDVASGLLDGESGCSS